MPKSFLLEPGLQQFNCATGRRWPAPRVLKGAVSLGVCPTAAVSPGGGGWRVSSRQRIPSDSTEAGVSHGPCYRASPARQRLDFRLSGPTAAQTTDDPRTPATRW